MTAESALVTGGCGFLGHHIVRELLEDDCVGQIIVTSRNPIENVYEGVIYRAGDIVDAEFVNKLFAEFTPTIVFHTASPRVIGNDSAATCWTDTNITGTQNLLSAAKSTTKTKAFIYSSSVNVIAGNKHEDAKEDNQQYWKPTDRAIPYMRSKAAAEQLVLGADGSSLMTVALRPCLIIGIGEHAFIPAQLDALEQGKTKIQLGNNKNLFDTVSAENCAKAHLLTMHALLEPAEANGKVNGEAFNITDGDPLPFWDIARLIWNKAGDTTEPRDVRVIPAWLANAMAAVSEIACKILFFGSKEPELNRHVVSFCINSHTYNIDKAKSILGYKPSSDMKSVIEVATQGELERRAKVA